MGLNKIKRLNAVEVQGEQEVELHCPELEGKPIGFVLQKVLYTKSDGGDGYKFDIKQAFSSTSRKTFKEAVDGTPAEAVDKLLLVLKDKDEREQPGTQTMSGQQTQRSMLGNGAQPQSRLQQVAQQQAAKQAPDFDDDIPF
ncbi:hypothetical protein [Yersinia enterocolitica]|nr:hypothetical protein [Yersinia enterocolitica]